MTATVYDPVRNKTAPANSPEVGRIMREKGVGRAQAYKLLREETAAAIDTSDVSHSQKELVLTTIIDQGIRNSIGLDHALPAIPRHDVHKLLWACQKMGWVTFRERKASYGTNGKPKLYAIKVLPEGYAAAKTVVSPKPKEEVTIQEQLDSDIVGNDNAMASAEAMASAQLSEAEVVETRKPTEVQGLRDLSFYTLIEELLQRADKADQLEKAAEILEAAGEDDLATQVITKVSFTPLEKEVIHLARAVWGDD